MRTLTHEQQAAIMSIESHLKSTHKNVQDKSNHNLISCFKMLRCNLKYLVDSNINFDLHLEILMRCTVYTVEFKRRGIDCKPYMKA